VVDRGSVGRHFSSVAIVVIINLDDEPMAKSRRPACTVCKSRTVLARISPIEMVHELRTFECAKCGHVDRYVVKGGPDSYWVLLQDSILDQLAPPSPSGIT
jgi:hypothetical protein